MQVLLHFCDSLPGLFFQLWQNVVLSPVFFTLYREDLMCDVAECQSFHLTKQVSNFMQS